MEKQKEHKAGFFKRFTSDLYEVTLYIKDETTGMVNTRTYMMQSVKKLTNNVIIGRDENGHLIEFSSTIPFDYEKRKLY